MIRALLTAALLVLFAAPTLAKTSTGGQMKSVDLGGTEGLCGAKKSAADDRKSIEDYAKAHDWRVIDFKGMDQKALLGAFNDMPPPTYLKDEIVSAVVSDKVATMFVMDAGRLCALHPISAKDFDTMVDKAFGSGS